MTNVPRAASVTNIAPMQFQCLPRYLSSSADSLQAQSWCSEESFATATWTPPPVPLELPSLFVAAPNPADGPAYLCGAEGKDVGRYWISCGMIRGAQINGQKLAIAGYCGGGDEGSE